MKQDKPHLTPREQQLSPALGRLVTIDVCGAENIVTIVSQRDSIMQDEYAIAGANQKVTVSLLPGTRISISSTGAENHVFVSKQLTVAHFDSTGADNQLEYLSDQ